MQSHTNLRRRCLAAFIGAAVSLSLGTAFAQEAYPSRPVRLVVPYAAGGPIDFQARVVAERMGRALRQTVVVENVVGASGKVATEQVMRAVPDGYVLLFGGLSTHVLNPAFMGELRYDPVKDFTVVGMAVENPVVLVASPKMGVHNMADFVGMLRASPGKYAYGSAGIGTSTHIGVELLLRTLGLSALHVPYKGTAPVMTDLRSGTVQFAVDSVGPAVERIKAGELVGLVVLNTVRSESIPQVPSLADVGLPNATRAKVVAWQAIFGPAKMPEPVVASLNAALQETLSDPALVARFKAQGLPVMPGYTAEKSATLLREDLARWTEFAKASGIKME